jgi:hypothetical protein
MSLFKFMSITYSVLYATEIWNERQNTKIQSVSEELQTWSENTTSKQQQNLNSTESKLCYNHHASLWGRKDNVIQN